MVVSELLPREERIRWVVENSARLSEGGAEPVSGLVLPTAKFFPDRFARDAASVKQLLKRVVKLAGLSGVAIRTRLVAPEDDDTGGNCGTGACGVGGGTTTSVRRVEDDGAGFTVNILANELSNPTVLTTAMVRAVSHIFMKEAELYPSLEHRDAEHGTDLCGVLLGFGALLCNGAYIYKKG